MCEHEKYYIVDVMLSILIILKMYDNICLKRVIYYLLFTIVFLYFVLSSLVNESSVLKDVRVFEPLRRGRYIMYLNCVEIYE